MEVVLNIGLQYLWVDRYCIQQSDPIYNNAIATIIAAAGTDSMYGLPGVGRTPGAAQPFARVGKHRLVSTLSTPKDLITRSRWNTRAWVYQEALFSRRRLIFTEQQVFFKCNPLPTPLAWA